MKCSSEKREKKLLFLFIQLFAPHLKKNQSLNGQSLLKSAIESPHLTPNGIELIFGLVKILGGVSLDNFLGLLEEQLKLITAWKEQKSLQ